MGCRDGIPRLPLLTGSANTQWGLGSVYDSLRSWWESFLQRELIKSDQRLSSFKVIFRANKSTEPETLFKGQELRDAGVRQGQLESKYSQIPGAFLPSMLIFASAAFSTFLSCTNTCTNPVGLCKSHIVLPPLTLVSLPAPCQNPHQALPVLLHLVPAPYTCQKLQQVLHVKGSEEKIPFFSPQGHT